MHRLLLRAAAAALTVPLLLSFPTLARAMTSAERTCQQTIGREGARFAARKQDAIVACNDAIVDGGACDTAQRDATIAQAAQRLSQQLARYCKNANLADLGFPGLCTDQTGGTFSVSDLDDCIEG